jgi:hypothetical protein
VSLCSFAYWFVTPMNSAANSAADGVAGVEAFVSAAPAAFGRCHPQGGRSRWAYLPVGAAPPSRSPGASKAPLESEDSRSCATPSSAEAVEVREGLDDGKYAYSWYENAPDVACAEAAVDGGATGAGLTSHF